MHEQRKPWVPLILEASYRPNGWLGIMLGSRMYYEFTEAALSTAQEWERVANGVSQEVRRHGSPPPSSEVAAEARPHEAVVAASPAGASAAAAPDVPTREVSAAVRQAAAGVNVSSAVHSNLRTAANYNISNSSNDHISSSNSNIGNTSIVLL